MNHNENHNCRASANKSKSESVAVPLNFSAQYTCPMHPEIKRPNPGSCPKCGMSLELMVATLNTLPDPELPQMQRRFWVSAILSLLVLVIAMGPMISPGLFQTLPAKGIRWSEFLLSTPVVLWGAWPFFYRGWLSLLHKSLNMFTLISLGIATAYVYSLIALCFPHFFPSHPLTHQENIGLFFESAAIITTLALLGQVLELKARSTTSLAIHSLLKLMPNTARLVRKDGGEEDVEVSRIRVGDSLRVRPGEAIPLDGIVMEGVSAVDESMISGEHISIDKTVGSEVTGGTLNNTGSFLMRVEKVGADTILSKIIHLVSEAQRTKAPVQKLVDKVSSYFVPFVLLLSLMTFMVWYFFGPEPHLNYAIINSVAVLIIACPCAIGLATPLSIMVGVGKGAEGGILIKNAEAIETLQKFDTLVIDKTGTLTLGKPHLITIVTNSIKENVFLQLVASLENASEHPLAQSIVTYALERNIPLLPVTNFRAHIGKGAEAVIEGKRVLIGKTELFRDTNIPTSPYEKQAEALRKKGQTVMLIAINNQIKGMLGVGDPIKPFAQESIQQLRADGIKIVMASGDHKTTAQVIADQLGIVDVHAGILPAEKIALIQDLKKTNRKVAMAGDGINDAPALAEAHIGIAMGTGTDVAIQSADVILVKGDLRGLVRARHLSHEIIKNIRQNLFLAFLYNFLSLPVAAGIFYPFFGVLLNPMVAAAAMSLSSISVIWNALRLRKVPIQQAPYLKNNIRITL